MLEVLTADDDTVVMLEGRIEDIDILSPTGVEKTIQCKYHEEQKFQMSSVVKPILEMLCHFIECQAIGREMKYILYAYFQNNVDSINQSDFNDFLLKTSDEEVLVKYFPRVFKIDDDSILELSMKPKKSKNDKQKIREYFLSLKSPLFYRVELPDFFKCFEYCKAVKYDELTQAVIEHLNLDAESVTVENLYYPNALTKISELSMLSDSELRKICKRDLWVWLNNQKTLLINKWIFEIQDRKKVLKTKKDYLSSMFSGNTDVRAFVFSKTFLANNANAINQFIREYISKYYSKKKLQNPPIFVLESDIQFLHKIVMELHKYQINVNCGTVVGYEFIEDSFINNTCCSNDLSAKITLTENMNNNIFQKCNINYLFYIGNQLNPIIDSGFGTEILGISTMSELKYLIGTNKILLEG